MSGYSISGQNYGYLVNFVLWKIHIRAFSALNGNKTVRQVVSVPPLPPLPPP